MDEIIEKLKSIRGMIDECISSYGGEESLDEEEVESSFPEKASSGDEVGDKIKLAATMLKKRMG